MRAYVTALRAIFAGGEPPAEGTKFPTRFRFSGFQQRPDLPIYIAGLSPKMLELAGELGDGVVLWLCNPEYIRDFVIPHVPDGPRKAGNQLDGFAIYPPCRTP